MKFTGPTYGAWKFERLGGRGEAGAVNGVWVLALIPLGQERLPVNGDPRCLERTLHCTFHLVVVDAGDGGGGRGPHQVDVGASHAKI